MFVHACCHKAIHNRDGQLLQILGVCVMSKLGFNLVWKREKRETWSMYECDKRTKKKHVFTTCLVVGGAEFLSLLWIRFCAFFCAVFDRVFFIFSLLRGTFVESIVQLQLNSEEPGKDTEFAICLEKVTHVFHTMMLCSWACVLQSCSDAIPYGFFCLEYRKSV